MEAERLKQIILNVYSGHIGMQDVADLLSLYMERTRGTVHTDLLQYLVSNPGDPIRMQMLQNAVEVCKEYFQAKEVCITRVYDKNNNLIKVF